MNQTWTSKGKILHCATYVSANSKSHQRCWGKREMGTAISCKNGRHIGDSVLLSNCPHCCYEVTVNITSCREQHNSCHDTLMLLLIKFSGFSDQSH